MPQFPHLPLPKKIQASYKHRGIPIERQLAETTETNLQNRRTHGRNLRRSANQLRDFWFEEQENRSSLGFPDLPNSDIIPVFLQIDPELFDPESLYSFGIEVISEEGNGYIIGASTDNFVSLKEKINKFVANEGKFKNKAAQLWNIIQGNQWRIEQILSPELREKWEDIADDEIILVDVSIACYLKISKAPNRKNVESMRAYRARYARWQAKKNAIEAARFDLEEQRQDEFQQFIQATGGEIVTSFVSYEDSFSCRLRLPGIALKDLVLNYQYLFDVSEYEDITFLNPVTNEQETIGVDFIAPENTDPVICVIDSGIQENHQLLSDAIDSGSSHSYLPGNASVADEVSDGGHGTKVTGGVLFGNEIPKEGEYVHEIWIQNARILNQHKLIPEQIYPPQIMEQIVVDYEEAKIFNLSINATRPCNVTHMSSWAATIDKLSNENDKLFIVSAGNIYRETGSASFPGISEYIAAGHNYPAFLLRNPSRIANPAQSCFAITVGSVCTNKFQDDDRTSFGERDEPSSFSRTGPGLWRMIKPDVVEYGGDYVREKSVNPLITVVPASSAQVAKTTINGNNAVGYDIGTSYAASKVSHIAGKILKAVPGASANLIRALIAQGARLPGDKVQNPQQDDLRKYGFGIADKGRSTENSATRITLISESEIAPKQAEIYTVKIPDELRGVADEFDILVEVCLTFHAKPRRTRRRMKSYLSAWLDWKSSKFGESYNQFKNRVTQYTEEDDLSDFDDTTEEDAENIKWKIRENSSWGSVKGFRRQDSSLQKDWVILKPHELSDSEEFSIAVIGHQGWEKDIFQKVKYSLTVSFEVLNANIEVYELIRIENEIEVEQEIIV